MLLARGTVRQREVAVRASLGATRWQLFSQFLAESLALASIGGALGISLAWVMLKVIVVLLPPFSVPTEADIRLSLPVLFFTWGATVLAGVLCGCAPAWQTSPLELERRIERRRAFRRQLRPAWFAADSGGDRVCLGRNALRRRWTGHSQFLETDAR